MNMHTALFSSIAPDIIIIAVAIMYMSVLGITLKLMFKLHDVQGNVQGLRTFDDVGQKLGKTTTAVGVGVAAVPIASVAAGTTGAASALASGKSGTIAASAFRTQAKEVSREGIIGGIKKIPVVGGMFDQSTNAWQDAKAQSNVIAGIASQRGIKDSEAVKQFHDLRKAKKLQAKEDSYYGSMAKADISFGDRILGDEAVRARNTHSLSDTISNEHTKSLGQAKNAMKSNSAQPGSLMNPKSRHMDGTKKEIGGGVDEVGGAIYKEMMAEFEAKERAASGNDPNFKFEAKAHHLDKITAAEEKLFTKSIEMKGEMKGLYMDFDERENQLSSEALAALNISDPYYNVRALDKQKQQKLEAAAGLTGLSDKMVASGRWTEFEYVNGAGEVATGIKMADMSGEDVGNKGNLPPAPRSLAEMQAGAQNPAATAAPQDTSNTVAGKSNTPSAYPQATSGNTPKAADNPAPLPPNQAAAFAAVSQGAQQAKVDIQAKTANIQAQKERDIALKQKAAGQPMMSAQAMRAQQQREALREQRQNSLREARKQEELAQNPRNADFAAQQNFARSGQSLDGAIGQKANEQLPSNWKERAKADAEKSAMEKQMQARAQQAAQAEKVKVNNAFAQYRQRASEKTYREAIKTHYTVKPQPQSTYAQEVQSRTPEMQERVKNLNPNAQLQADTAQMHLKKAQQAKQASMDRQMNTLKQTTQQESTPQNLEKFMDELPASERKFKTLGDIQREEAPVDSKLYQGVSTTPKDTNSSFNAIAEEAADELLTGSESDNWKFNKPKRGKRGGRRGRNSNA